MSEPTGLAGSIDTRGTATTPTTPGTPGMPGARVRPPRRGRWITIMCLGAIVLLLAGSWLLAPRPSGEEEGFAGTDSTVSRLLEESGTTPWFHPVFTPGSGEIESGLFALQAALGAGLFGYAVGRLHGRHRVPPPSRDGAGPAAGTAPGAAPNAAPDRGR